MIADRPGGLVRNMSCPPKTVVKYSGLADLAPARGNAGRGLGGEGAGVFGTPVLFALPADVAAMSPAQLLQHLGVPAHPEPERELAGLIDARADQLPLPDGCAVIPALEGHRIVWADTLSALAVLAKCSDSIWLRSKNPALNAALARRQATLLVPPLFARNLPESPT